MFPRITLFAGRPTLEDAALERIFHEYYPRIYAVIFRMLGDAAAADDLTAETFLRLWQSPPAAAQGEGENLGGWLYRVATRIAYNALRSAKRRHVYETQSAQSLLLTSPTPDPATEAEAREARQRVRQVFAKMTEREAQLLVLRHSGLAYQEIAQAVGVKPGSVGSLLTRAEAKFEALYSKGESDAPER